MEIVFGTTNKRKEEDLQNLINLLNVRNIRILSMSDIGWDRGEIVENGRTIEENSLIKANAIREFCKEKNLNYSIITDDAGLFCDALEGEPGIYTARYADDEISNDPSLPKHQSIYKLLRNLENKQTRSAQYKCAVTYMYPNGDFFQEVGQSKGRIAKEFSGEPKKPYLYGVFILDGTEIPFRDVTDENVLKQTYRYQALRAVLSRVLDLNQEKDNDDELEL